MARCAAGLEEPGSGGQGSSSQWEWEELFKEELLLELGLWVVEQHSPGLEKHPKQKGQKPESVFFSLGNGVQFNWPEHGLPSKRAVGQAGR